MTQNALFSELTVILKDDSRTYRHKFESYNTYTIGQPDEYITQCVKEAKNSFKDDPTDIIIKVTYVLQ